MQECVIEISHGFLRRRSAIYGPYRLHWRMVEDKPMICLADRKGLSVEAALRLINTYPSLQAMLDRINELEQELKTANSVRQDWNAATYVLLRIIQADRQFYRSKSSEHIRECLEIVREWQKHRESEPSSDKIMVWRKVFPPVTEMARMK
ncbi:MAG: hypothetical protein Q8R55_06080 [Candidatus Taylorbacteria bacterium]|nr:hypothetical protein [Candidatus Taylorbacteria bacterium]